MKPGPAGPYENGVGIVAAQEHHSPLEQFRIEHIGGHLSLGGYDISFNNSALWMLIAVAAITVFMLIGIRKQAVVPGRWQALVEFLYDFVANMLKENVGSEGRKYFPWVFSIFMFVLFCNLFGLLPKSFTVTSHIIVTFALAMMVFLIVTAIGFIRHGFHFLSFFVPKGAPVWLLPLMIPIEVISYFIRPMSLSVRLFANMVAGHVMLVVLGSFVLPLGLAGAYISGIVPVAAITAIIGLEFLIACLQAYVFTILTCIYLNDAVHMHH
ncbi:F0F1 ATP synthase subunit A [Dongia soli]|uniref:ATP synthase subunit a n=2 Tax=Dongia soli TaxID=600628 RepID=A0ABU5EC49_9PROT|nr:F0F1 ATP synthase subunit A [Dongia soli]MDY0883947.1 F0F1 ATP synthase subunit A [Dongia soli]